MRGVTAEELMDCLEAAGCGYDPPVLDRLWAGVPRAMRVSRLSASSVPEPYRGALTEADGSRNVVDLAGVPEPMRRELAWCLWRVVELGGKIPMPSAAMLTRRLGEVVADLGGQAPVSLMDLSARTWCREIPLAVRRRRGVLPAASSIRHMRELLLRCLRLLGTAYDHRPWWQRESWNPVEDTRVPLRQHEPLGRQAVHFHRIRTPWLRGGVQWYCKVSLETGTLRWSTVNQRVFVMTVFDAFLIERGGRDPDLADDPARGAGADAGLPRPCARLAGHPRPDQGPAGLRHAREDPAGRRRTVLRLHARERGHSRGGVARAGLAAAGPAARQVLPARRASPPYQTRPRPGHHRRERPDPGHGRDRCSG
jgi:hypothetical protein